MLLQDLQKPYGPLLIDVEKRIRSILLDEADSDMISLVEAAPIRGGKKIRSTFLFMLLPSPENFAPEAVDLAAAVEMIHQASLIHDDVLDHAQTRRDRPTLHHVVDNSMAVLAGDYLFIKALELVATAGSFNYMRSVLAATRNLTVGQVADMKPESSGSRNFEQYIRMLELKTGSLFGTAAELAAMLKGLDESAVTAYRSLGLSLGVLFQLQDDVLDLFSHKTGKDRWVDLREGKWTLPILHLFEADPGFEVFPFSEARIPDIDAAFSKHKIEARCKETVAEFRRRTDGFSDGLISGLMRKNIGDLVDYVCRRER